MKLSVFLSSILITLNIFTTSVAASASAPAPSADSAVLMNGITGEILYSKNPNGVYPPASTTKILTTLLALENCKLDDIITVGDGPAKADGSSIYLLPGEQVTVGDVLYGLNLQSGNDCAEALAEHISGSVEKFSELMNSRAKELGCENTNFVNPSGLYHKDHRTSAKDLALILKELVKHPEYLKIASTMTHIIEPNNKSVEKRYIWNKNKLLQPGNKYYYKDAWAGKTGYTTQSQHSYVAVAERDGQILIVTLVHDCTTDYYKDTINLFNYGFNNFKTNSLFSKNEALQSYTLEDNTSIPVLAKDNFFYSSRVGSESQATFDIKLNEAVLKTNNIRKGDVIGNAEISLEGKTIGTMELISGADHEVKPIVPDSILNLVAPSEKKAVSFIIYVLYGFGGLVLLILCIRTYNLRIKKYIKRIKRKRAGN